MYNETVIRCVYVSFEADNSGGGIGSKVNKHLLESIFNKQVLFIEFPRTKNKIHNLCNTLIGYIHGMNHSLSNQIIEEIACHSPEYVFINASQYGLLAKRIKKTYPKILVITFFHDIEVLFCWSAFKRLKKPQNLLTLVTTYYNEKLIVRYSDKLICLNDREAKNLDKIYHRTPDLLLPSSLTDRLDVSRIVQKDPLRTRAKGIFVGSYFFANYFGIKWFVDNVASKINADIEIVGLNFEYVRTKLEIYDNIKVIGSVDHIDAYYYDADFVIAPIYDGAGMKIKTAEALMFGKTIFGTPEAFVGYDIDFAKVGGLCNNYNDFIERINEYNLDNNRFNSYSRKIYLEKYSFDQSLIRLKSLFVF